MRAPSRKPRHDIDVSSPDHGHPDHESLKSNPSSLKREGPRSRSAASPKRSKGAPALSVDDELSRGPSQGKRRLWNPDDHVVTPPWPTQYDISNVATDRRLRQAYAPHSRRLPSHTSRQSGSRPAREATSTVELIKQPETQPISQEQLVAEVKGIYAGLVMVENKCIEVDKAQNANSSDVASNTKLNNEQWQALIALHRTLLHEHHDFFLASQHPAASPALRRLASKYSMPARMWRHGIHSFLELVRHRLPHSLDHMLTFIFLAYSTMAQLYEIVPAFEDTWIECIGDLGRYGMATGIEDDNVGDREIRTAVSLGRYSKAANHCSLGQSHHGKCDSSQHTHRRRHICRARLHGKEACFGIMPAPQSASCALDVPSPNTCILDSMSTPTRPTSRHIPNNFRSGGGALSRLLRFFIPFFMFSFSLALATTPLPPQVPWHMPKVCLLASSALGSLFTGMVSLNNDISTTAPSADIRFRVVSACLTGVLAVGYPFWYLGQGPRKTRQFNRGVMFVVGFWVIVRVFRALISSGGEKTDRSSGSDSLWLTEFILLALASVVAGIMNAERSIFSSVEGDDKGDTTTSGDDDDDDDDEGRERRNGDIESQPGGGGNGPPSRRRLGNGDNASPAGPSVMERFSTALQAVSGAVPGA